MSGLIFDLTGSYQAAFLNGLGWNLVNVSIVVWLMFRPGRRGWSRLMHKILHAGFRGTQVAPSTL